MDIHLLPCFSYSILCCSFELLHIKLSFQHPQSLDLARVNFHLKFEPEPQAKNVKWPYEWNAIQAGPYPSSPGNCML